LPTPISPDESLVSLAMGASICGVKPDVGDRRGHDQKLFKKRFRLNVRKYVFSNRVIDGWNLLPASCINYSTINTFKNHLLTELESEAVKFKVCQLG